MEFICELFFEVLLEGIFGLTVENPRIKTWVKTLIFLLFSEAVAGLFGWLSVLTYLNGNRSGGIVCGIVSLTLGIGFLVAVIYSHKKKWKQD